jgi:hypothetical protein
MCICIYLLSVSWAPREGRKRIYHREADFLIAVFTFMNSPVEWLCWVWSQRLHTFRYETGLIPRILHATPTVNCRPRENSSCQIITESKQDTPRPIIHLQLPQHHLIFVYDRDSYDTQTTYGGRWYDKLLKHRQSMSMIERSVSFQSSGLSRIRKLHGRPTSGQHTQQ